MQVAFNGVLFWVLYLPMTMYVEFLHILANLLPPWCSLPSSSSAT